MKKVYFLLLFFIISCPLLKSQSFCDAEFSCNVPSITFSAASISGWGDSAVHIPITNNSAINYAYPQAKLFNVTPLPPGMTQNSNFNNYWMPFASSWNSGQTSPFDCGYDVTTPIPANFQVTFTLWLRPNDVAVGYDSCRFQTSFIVNLNPQSSIEEKTNYSEIIVSPNPTNSEISFVILNENQEAITVQILNVMGEVVFTKDPSIENSIDLSALPSGIYFAKIKNSKGEILGNKKIVKE